MLNNSKMIASNFKINPSTSKTNMVSTGKELKMNMKISSPDYSTYFQLNQPMKQAQQMQN